jgi:tyrosyl-tRNA synthetase
MGIAELARNAVDLLPAGALEAKLKLGRPLRIKLGIDPTSPDLHLGFAYALENLRAFQEEGHEIVLIVGDYTARIGDPSGRSAERPVLPGEVLDANAKEFEQQAYRIIDPERTTIRFNGEWLGTLTYEEVVRLCRTLTVARLLERDDFSKRFAAHAPISLSELLYPLMQAYDSVAIEADIEVGGTDQLYNLLAGRDVMAQYGLEPQVVMTFPLLIGLDGEEKMSKSKGNYIAVQDPPEEMYGKVMSIPDELLSQWWDICLGREQPAGDPMSSKLALARGLVEKWHGGEAAARAEERWSSIHRRREIPGDVPEASLPDGDPLHLPALLVERLGVGSTSEARRLIQQGGVKLDGAAITELDVPRERLEGATLQAGKRRFVRFLRA